MSSTSRTLVLYGCTSLGPYGLTWHRGMYMTIAILWVLNTGDTAGKSLRGQAIVERVSKIVHLPFLDFVISVQIRGATAPREILFSLSVYLTTLGCATPSPLPTFSDLSAGPVIEEGCSVASSIDFRKRCSNLRGTGRSWIDSSNLCAFLYHSPFLLRSRERTEMGRSNCCSIAQR